MLFLPDSVYKTRRSLIEDLDRGKPPAQVFQRMLELDPCDHLSLCELGRLRSKAGDAAGAQEYFWRSVQAQPCHWSGFFELAGLLDEQPNQKPLSMGLSELAFRKLRSDEEAMDRLAGAPLLTLFEGIEGIEDMSPAERVTMMADVFRERRDLEPVEVTAHLRPHRLIQQLQELTDVDAQLVDALVGEGKVIVPLLVGVLRGWAQNFLPEDDESVVENALAVLGEIGDAAAIPHLLEFIVRDQVELAGAAGWAFDRIIELNPEAAAREIGEIASDLDVHQRIAVAERLVRFSNLDPECALLARLGQDLKEVSKEDLSVFVRLLVATMILRGRRGVELARALFRRNNSLLSREARVECDELIADFGAAPHTAPIENGPSEWTVYDICAGDAVWADDDEDDDEEDFLPPEPVQKHHTPGRNDPCWCGSGKKYKKCHLDADQRPANGPAPVASGELDRLRKRIGAFLAEVAPPPESQAAMLEFYKDEKPEEGENVGDLVDWMVHDWTLPGTGRTVLEEFLRRHGSSLPSRQREALASWSRSFVSLYEVRELQPGTGLQLNDLISGEVLFVHDVRLSNSLARWDGLLARVVEAERGKEFSGVGLSVPRAQLEPLRSWMTEDRRSSGLKWAEYLKRNLPRIRRALFEICEEWRESLQLQNSDGDEILFSKSVYRIVDNPAIVAALRSGSEIVEDEAGERYTWLNGSPDKSGTTVVGSVKIHGGELMLECNSKSRLDRGKTLLKGIAGSALQHLRDQFITQQEMKRTAMKEPSSPRPGHDEIPPEVRDKLVTEYLERHYSAWPDMTLPALDGKTPRQAVKTPAGRRKVAALLRDFENGEEHKRRAGEPYYEVARMRAELGLE